VCQIIESRQRESSTEDRGDRSGRRRRKPALYPGAREGQRPFNVFIQEKRRKAAVAAPKVRWLGDSNGVVLSSVRLLGKAKEV
jgi:hypothetical protein